MLGIIDSLKDYEHWNVYEHFKEKVEYNSFSICLYYVNSFSTFALLIAVCKLPKHINKSS